jgi:hypothetical protein
MKSLAKRWWFWVLIVVATAFVVVHTYLAIWVRDYVNRKLSEMPGYRARVAAVTLHLWRGAYQIHKITIEKNSAKCRSRFSPRRWSIFPCNGTRLFLSEHSSATSNFTAHN